MLLRERSEMKTVYRMPFVVALRLLVPFFSSTTFELRVLSTVLLGFFFRNGLSADFKEKKADLLNGSSWTLPISPPPTRLLSYITSSSTSDRSVASLPKNGASTKSRCLTATAFPMFLPFLTMVSCRWLLGISVSSLSRSGVQAICPEAGLPSTRTQVGGLPLIYPRPFAAT